MIILIHLQILVFKRLLKKYQLIFKKYKSKGKILEIGCNDGFLLELLNKKGFTSFGVMRQNLFVIYQKIKN